MEIKNFMSLFIKKKTIKKAISVMTMIMTVTVMSNVGMLSTQLAMADVVDGALIKSNATNSDGSPTLSSLDVYIVKLVGTKKFKRLVLNPTVFNSYGHLNWGDIQTVSVSVMDEYSTSALVRVDTDPDEKVYAMAPDGDIGSKSWVNVTAAEFLGVSGSEDGDSIYTINATDGGNYTAVGDITTTTQLETFYSAGTLPDMPVVAGDLAIALASDTPAAGSVAASVDNVLFTKINFTASSEADAVINSINMARSGLGSNSDIAAVTLYDGATKLGNTRTSFNSDNEMVFNIGGGWTIPAGTTRTLDVKVKVTTAGTFNALGISSSDDVVLASGTTSGSFPVLGNAMTAVTIADLGAVTVTGESTTNQTKKIGESDIQLAYFSLEETTSNEDLSFSRITVKNIGTAKDSAISNITLKEGGTILAEGVSMVNDYVTFDLSASPVVVAKGTKSYFKIYGDIADGDATTVEFNLRNDTDIETVGSVYGYNVTVTRSAFDTAGESITTTIDGSELNVSLTSVNVDTPDDVKNFEFARFNVSSGKDVKITDLILTIDETDGDGDATNNKDVDELELVDTGDNTIYGATMTNGGDGNAADETWTISSEEILITAGVTSTFIIRGDLPSGIGNGDQCIGNGDQYNVAMTIDTTDLIAETVDGGDVIDTFSVSSLTGKNVTVKAASLKVKSTPMNAVDAVISTSDVVVFKGSLDAGTASDITVERVRVEADAANQLDTANLVRAEFIVSGTTVADYITSFTTGELDFSELNVVVPKGTSVPFEIQVDLQDTFSANTTLHVQMDVVTAKDSDNTAVTATDEAGTDIDSAGGELDTTSETTLRASGALAVSLINVDAGYNKDRYVLAGSDIATSKLQLRAYYEDILLKDLTLTNLSTADEDSVVTISLYDDAALTNLVGSTTLSTSDLALFDDMNYTVTKGTHNLYVQVNTAAMGDGPAETADLNDSFQFKVDDDVGSGLDVDAEGVDSGVALADGDNDSTVDAGEVVFDLANNGTYDEAGDTATANSKTFTVVGTQITAIELASSYGTTSVASSISGTGTYNVAILKITNNTTTNKNSSGILLKTALEDISLKVDKHATTMALSGMTIERIGGTVSAKALTEVAGAFTAADATGYADINNADDAASLSSDALIESGGTAYYLIKATISALDATAETDNWMQVSLDDLDGSSNANISWQQDDTATDMNALYLDYTTVDGIKISE